MIRIGMGAIQPGDTSIPQDYSGGEYWDPNGGGMVEALTPAQAADPSIMGDSSATTAAQLAAAGVTSSTPSLSSFFSSGFQVGSITIPYWLPALAFLPFLFRGMR